MVRIAHFFMQFTQNESCGKCVPCREGTRQLLAMLDDVREGTATQKTLDTMQNLAHVVRKASLCGLGKTAPNPVLSTMRFFAEEYRQHVEDKHCACGECKALLKPEISATLCKGCTLCGKKCPVGAITGELKKAHVIDVGKCVKCGVCAQVCKFNAVMGVQK
jgi:NADH-quinone oxidoreductase subunit F